MPANNYSYIFFVPPPAKNSAGITFFYDLAKELRGRGFDAWTTSDIKDTFFLEDPNERTIPFSTALGVIRFGKAIAVYPDIVSGNPLGSKRVVRIVANKPGYLGGDEEYQASERVFLFSHYYTQYVKSPISGYLYTPSVTISDLESFKITNKGRRGKKIFYQGKGKKVDLYITNEYSEITRTSPKRAELPALFKQADHIIVFDNSTALIQEAALCGCVPIIIPDGSFLRDDLERFELSDTGVAWGINDLERARKSLPLLRGKIIEAIDGYQSRLNNFLNITQGSWNEFSENSFSDERLLLEAISFERDLLWNFIKDSNYNWKLAEFGAEVKRVGASESVLVWGADTGTISAIQVVSLFSKVVAVTGEENKISEYLNASGIPYVPPAEVVDIASNFDSIVVASVFREQIFEKIKRLGLYDRKRVIFLSQGFLSNSEKFL